MALSEPRVIYGVHSVTPRSRSTGEPYGILRVLKDSSIALSSELVKLTGGSNKYPWAIEDGNFSGEMSLKFDEYPNFVMELFLGKAPTANSAETAGSVTTLTNVNGTLVASVGLASVSALSGSEADLKFAQYLIKAVSATTVDVFLMSDVDGIRGADLTYQNDLLKITASPLTITTGADTTIPNTGVKITGGAGTIGMTSGHTASFSTRPINAGSMDVVIGATTDITPEFAALVVAQKRATGEMFEIDAFRCKGSGLPIGFAEKAFSEVEVKAELIYDSAKNGVFKMRHVQF